MLYTRFYFHSIKVDNMILECFIIEQSKVSSRPEVNKIEIDFNYFNNYK